MTYPIKNSALDSAYGIPKLDGNAKLSDSVIPTTYFKKGDNATDVAFDNVGTPALSTDVQGVIIEIINALTQMGNNNGGGGGSTNSNQITNSSNVSGSSISDALNNLLTDITAIPTSYNTGDINNNSTVSGTTLNDALATLKNLPRFEFVYWDPTTNTPPMNDYRTPGKFLLCRYSATISSSVLNTQQPDFQVYNGHVIYYNTDYSQWTRLNGAFNSAVIFYEGDKTNFTNFAGSNTVENIISWLNNYFGNPTLNANLDANSKRIVNCANPLSANDVSNKSYCDSNFLTISNASSTYQPISSMSSYIKTNGTVAMASSLNLNSNKIVNLGLATSSGDAISKAYLDTALIPYLTTSVASTTYLTTSQASSTYQLQSAMASYLTTSQASSTYQTQSGMASYLTTSQASSTYQLQSAMASYLTTSQAASTYQTQSGMTSYLKKDGTVSMTGALDMGTTNKIINLSAPTSNADATTKLYVDTAIAGVSAGGSVATSMSRYNLSVGRASSTGGTFTSLSTNLGGVANFQYCECFCNQIGKYSSLHIKLRLRAGSGLAPWSGVSPNTDLFIIKLNPLFGTGVSGNIFSAYNNNQQLYAIHGPQRGFSGSLAGSGSAVSVYYVIDVATSQISLLNNDGNPITIAMLQNATAGDCQCEIRLDYIAA